MRRGISINFTLTNRWLYSLIFLTIILIMGVGVYAVNVDTTKGWHESIQIQGLGALAVKDSVDWNTEIINIPDDIADGDDVGSGGLISCRIYTEGRFSFTSPNTGWSAYSSGDTECSGWVTSGYKSTGSASPQVRTCIQCQ